MTAPAGAVTGAGPQPRAGAPEATLALTGLTVAVALGMGRLFEGGGHLVPLLGAAVAGHAVMWAGRRRGAPIGACALAALACVALAAAWLLFPETTTVGLPGPGTLSAARSALADAWSRFGDVVAPAPASDGFVLAAMVGVGVTAVLADWAAFRMRVLFEAMVPSFTLFAFTATLGTAENRSAMVALYLGALLLFLVVHRAGLEAEGTSWFASRSRGGTGALLRGAAVLGTAAVAAAVVVGPNLPGATAEAVLTWRDTGRDGDGRRSTVSPLVDIRGRLVDQSTTEVFTVRTDQPAYWRLTSLDTFNGQIWSSDASYRPVGRRLPAPGLAPAADRVVQEFRIGALSSIWLPAAYRPAAVGGIDDVSYNADLGSLITGEDTTDGLTYTVESAVPRFTAAELRRAGPGTDGPEDVGRFLALPPVSGRVAALARDLRAGGDGTAFGTALALQSHFRQRFVYDLNAGPGHDERALENFLFRDRRGYCEQFAGAFAVMARLVGLPTRVAVGFTPGEPDADGVLHVRGLNAHAWPEVLIDGFGWVAFEPTPGRGAPGADAYLGVPPAQASPENPNTATTAAPPTTAAGGEVPTPSTTVAPGAVAAGAGAEAGEDRPLTRRPLVLAVLAAVLVAVAATLAVPLAKSARRRRRRAGAATAADRVWVAWTEAEDAVGRAGAPRRPSETLAEHARRAAPAAALPDEAAAALATLAADAAAASYAAAPVDEGVASRATRSAATVEHHVTGLASTRQRVLWAFDPRPLLPRRGAGPAPRRRRRR